MSYRSFERHFYKKIGVTPKKFQQISRLENTVKKILLEQPATYLPTVLDNGYYDQSHFLKEFKQLSGETTFNYFQNMKEKNHFYFKSFSSLSNDSNLVSS